MKLIIHVHETGNPTPNRGWDYTAITDDYDGAEDSGHQCIGQGKSKWEAVKDLVDHIEHCDNFK